MNEEKSKSDRRSTRLTISIPIVISGVDAQGQTFNESVRTLIVNKHGGKIATTHAMTMGSEVQIEHRALGVLAKAKVVWLGSTASGNTRYAGLQLLEAQNIWGIAFPPDDWNTLPGQAEPPSTAALFADEHEEPLENESQVMSRASEETTIKLLQEMKQTADARALEFHDRLNQLVRRLGLESELDPSKPAACVNACQLGTMEEEIKCLKESLRTATGELGKLGGEIQKLRKELESAGNLPPSLQEAQRQLSSLSKSVVEGMNRAAEDGLRQYRTLLQKENQRSTASLPPEKKTH